MHELEMLQNGEASMAYRSSKGRPWHDLGTPVGDDLTPLQMMQAAGVDWGVTKYDTFVDFVDADGSSRRIKAKRQALVRDTDGKVLTDVGPGWNPVQNATAFDFFTEFVSKGDMVMDTAGSLKDGQIVWALADVKEGFELFGGDQVRGYLLFSNPHIYGKSLDIKFVMERVVCWNTISVALNEVGQPSVKLNHRSKFEAERVKEILGIGHNKLDTFRKAAEFLGSKRYKKETLEEFIGDVFGRSEKDGSLTRNGEEALRVIDIMPGTEFAEGSWWQAFNAVTYLTDHKLGREADTRMVSATFGPNATRKLTALDLAVKMAEAA